MAFLLFFTIDGFGGVERILEAAKLRYFFGQ